MLKQLNIQNIILIEQAVIVFDKGLNVISGETGSGKSAILDGLQLILGARTDTALIRHGAEKAVVEADFDISAMPHCQEFLEEKGIECDAGELFIRREIYSNGKSRAFINQQSVQLSLLKALSELLLEIVSQHANQKLLTVEHHRFLLDLYGGYHDKLLEYKAKWEKHQALEKHLSELRATLPQALREIEICTREVDEIHAARLKDNEEEELFAEYTLLASSEERLGHAKTLEQAFGSERGILAQLSRCKSACQQLAAKDSEFAEQLALYPQIVLEAEELLHSLSRYLARSNADPHRLETVNERLTLVNRLKRKYGKTVAEVQGYKQHQELRLKKLETIEVAIEAAAEELALSNAEIVKLADALSAKREKTSALLAKKMTAELVELNMQNAVFHIAQEKQAINSTGQDRIEFLLTSNKGEKQIALRENASGGELARVLLALQVLLADKEKISSLIFDEVDANIGGTTASIIGEKLKTIGKSLQVICITHFSQVAKFADYHLQISKSVQKGRTVAEVTTLDPKLREKELSRMVGV